MAAEAVNIAVDSLSGHLFKKSAKIIFAEAGMLTENVEAYIFCVMTADVIERFSDRFIFAVALQAAAGNIFQAVHHHVSDKLK